jgi:HlyD family secretion protein
MKRTVLIIASLMILIVGTACAALNVQLPVSSFQQPGANVVASGQIEADDIIVSSEVSGRVQTLSVEVGDEVSAGQVLIQLDTTTLDAQIERAEAEVQGAEATLAEVKAGARPEEIEIAAAAVEAATEGVALAEKAVALAQGNVDTAKATLKGAQADQARLQAGASPSDLALAEARLDYARQQLQATWAVRDSIGGSERRGELPKGSYEAAQAAVAQAETGVQIAELQLEELKAGARAEDLRAAQAAVDAAQAGVEAAQAQVVGAQQQVDAARARLREAQARLDLLKSGAGSEQIAIAQAKVSAAQAALQALQVQRSKMVLTAPRDGLVLEQLIHVGETATQGGILLRLANLDRVKLKIYVPVTDLGRIQIGQAARVSVDSFPGRVFEGRVIQIASDAEFTPRNLQTGAQRATQVVAVKIELPNPDHALKPGMPADATF